MEEDEVTEERILERELRITEGVEVVTGLPTVIMAASFSVIIPVVQKGPGFLFGWAGLPLLGVILCTILALRSYFKLGNLPRPKRVSKRRIRALGIFSFVYGLFVSSFFTIVSLTGTPQDATLMMGVAIIGAGVTLGINSVATALAFALPLLLMEWATVIYTGVLGWPAATALFLGVAAVVIKFAFRNKQITLEKIKLSLESQRALNEQLKAQEQLRIAEVEAARKEQERAAEAAQMQRAMINAIAFPMVLSHGNEALEVTPQARIDFKVAEDFQGLQLSEFFVNEADQTRMRELLAKDGTLDNYEVLMQDREGTQFWCEMALRPLDYQGQQCWLNSIYIIDARKRMEQEIAQAKDAAESALADLKTAQQSLVHAEKMASLGELTAGIAHEIKNPLNFVNNFAKLSAEMMDELVEVLEEPIKTLDEDDRDDVEDIIATVKGNLIKIDEHGSRADSIVKNMLAHSRQGGGEMQTIALNPLVEEAMNLAYHGARAADKTFNVTIDSDLAADGVQIDCLPQELQRVFLNLCGNAMYAAVKRDQPEGKKPTLTVKTRADGDKVVVDVTDNGDGIPAEIREKIFQPFFTTKPTGEGTGLGLSMSFDIVKQHGGKFDLDSEVGHGTTFSVTLPISKAA